MNKRNEVIYLAGILVIFNTKLAIAELGTLKDIPIRGHYPHSKTLPPFEDIVPLWYKGIATKMTTNLMCDRSLIQISINDSQKNTKANDILNYTNTIASQNSASDEAQASFWWAADQFDPFHGKLVENWSASSQKQQIDLTVNWHLWILLDYFARYRFVNQFGTVARKYGYSLNIFNQQDSCLASYQYNTNVNPPKWELNLEKYGKDSFQVKQKDEEAQGPPL
jgi:hypothetical protein